MKPEKEPAAGPAPGSAPGAPPGAAPGQVPASPHAIEVENLVKVYGDLHAVDGISFTVRQGEVFAFLGPNGAGKTTTVEIIENIRKKTSGQIRLFGKPMEKHLAEIKERIGVLPQEFKSFDRLTCRETLLYYQKMYRRRSDVDELLRLVDMTDKSGELYKNLSGGLKQRLGVALALVGDPDIVFLDEPTTGLDPKARRDVWHVIKDLRQRGKTVFLTTHYMEEAEYLADTVSVIHSGKIIASGTTEELIANHGRGETLVIRGCDVGEVSRLLENMGASPRRRENSDIEVRIRAKDQVTDILGALRDRGIRYKGIELRRPTLEEVFLNLTGTRLSDEGEDGEEDERQAHDEKEGAR